MTHPTCVTIRFYYKYAFLTLITTQFIGNQKDWAERVIMWKASSVVPQWDAQLVSKKRALNGMITAEVCVS